MSDEAADPGEVYFVPANQSRCFLCQPSPERFVDHVRDGSWTLCSAHMREVVALGNDRDASGLLRPID